MAMAHTPTPPPAQSRAQAHAQSHAQAHAQPASILDRSDMSRVVATIAGDDTVFVLAREPLNGKELGEYFYNLSHS